MFGTEADLLVMQMNVFNADIQSNKLLHGDTYRKPTNTTIKCL